MSLSETFVNLSLPRALFKCLRKELASSLSFTPKCSLFRTDVIRHSRIASWESTHELSDLEMKL